MATPSVKPSYTNIARPFFSSPGTEQQPKSISRRSLGRHPISPLHRAQLGVTCNTHSRCRRHRSSAPVQRSAFTTYNWTDAAVPANQHDLRYTHGGPSLKAVQDRPQTGGYNLAGSTLGASPAKNSRFTFAKSPISLAESTGICLSPSV